MIGAMFTQEAMGPDLESLNEEQRAAVEHDGGPLAVLAGPGTGKTRVIVSRIARLVADGASPESIVGLTFSIKAAREMQERLVEMLGPRNGANVTLSTFHAWGRRFLARYGDTIGHRVTPRIMDSAQRKALLGELIVEGGLFTSTRAMGVERAIETGKYFIEQSINAGREASEAVEFASNTTSVICRTSTRTTGMRRSSTPRNSATRPTSTRGTSGRAPSAGWFRSRIL